MMQKLYNLQRKQKSYFFQVLYKISFLTCFISIIGIVSNINNLLQISHVSFDQISQPSRKIVIVSTANQHLAECRSCFNSRVDLIGKYYCYSTKNVLEERAKWCSTSALSVKIRKTLLLPREFCISWLLWARNYGYLTTIVADQL